MNKMKLITEESVLFELNWESQGTQRLMDLRTTA